MYLYLDPWRWASLQQSTGQIVSRVANCTNCAHCVDLYTPRSDDAAELKKIRDEQYLTVMGWVEAHWRSKSTLKVENPHGAHTGHSMHITDKLRIGKFRLNE